MLTFQDLQQVPNIDRDRADFVRKVINEHKSSELYQNAVIADEYDRCRNRTIMRYEKTMHTVKGQVIRDEWSPNHKSTSNFFNIFVTQLNQYLLANGVSWKNAATEKKLGADFDTRLQQAGKAALVGGVSFGFFNLDHLKVFEVTEFAPLYDEENGALAAGVRFWQIDDSKPLRATLYEMDGYTNYLWQKDVKKAPDANVWARVSDDCYMQVKTPYKLKTRESEADGVEIYDGENYPTFPIVPLWGNPHKQSELVGMRENIDAYDLIFNGYENDLDNAQIFWVIKGAAGLSGNDDVDLLRFLERLRKVGGAALGEDQEVTPVPVNIPAEARELLLNRIERQLYRDFQAFNPDDVKSGSTVNAQIEAAYYSLDQKANEYEYCVNDFIYGIMKVAGIDDTFSFTRDKITNVTELIQYLIMSAPYLGREYVTRKILELLGDGDKADEVLAQIDAEDAERLANIPTETEGEDGNTADGAND